MASIDQGEIAPLKCNQKLEMMLSINCAFTTQKRYSNFERENNYIQCPVNPTQSSVLDRLNVCNHLINQNIISDKPSKDMAQI